MGELCKEKRKQLETRLGQQMAGEFIDYAADIGTGGYVMSRHVLDGSQVLTVDQIWLDRFG